jgi:hypothetical protein
VLSSTSASSGVASASAGADAAAGVRAAAFGVKRCPPVVEALNRDRERFQNTLLVPWLLDVVLDVALDEVLDAALDAAPV